MPIDLTYELLPSNNPNHIQVYMKNLQFYMSFLQGNRYLFLTNQITVFVNQDLT